jgi:cell wall-associated NlpC family hydrolase
MEYGICLLPVIPVRAEPSDVAEMVTQVLFGETALVLEEQKNWVRARCLFDDYEGWLDGKQLTPITYQDYQNLNDSILHVTTDPLGTIHCRSNEKGVFLPAGSSLPGLNGKEILLNGRIYRFEGHPAPMAFRGITSLIGTALSFLGSPYAWGGRTHFGIDCSGFTQVVFKINGIRLPRDARQQALEGEDISFSEEALPGDLAFFENKAGLIVHTGIVLEGGRIVHASGKVRIDLIDHQGIFNEKQHGYTHQLRNIRRITRDTV